MKQTKKKKQTKVDYKKKTLGMLYTKEVITGFIMVIVLLSISGYLLLNKKVSISPQLYKATKIVSPIPTNGMIDNKRPAKIVTTPKKETVKEGDSFWKISERGCGTGIYYEVIQQYNNYIDRSLQVGDTINIKCDFN